MRSFEIGAVTLLLITAGCGNGAACQALVQGTHDENSRGAACGHRSLVIDPPDCPEWLRGCTAADQQLLEAYGACLSRLPTCSPEIQEAWEQQVHDCAMGTTSEVSSTCS